VRLLYVVVALSGALYFLFKKRRFDFLSIGYFSALMYFLPALYGSVMSPYGPMDLVPSPLIPATYVVMLAVLLGIIAGAFVYDQVPHRVHRHVGLSGTVSAGNWALFFGATGCAMAILTSGLDTLMNIDKTYLLEHTNRWMFVWELGSELAVVFFFLRRQWFRFALAVLLVLFHVFIGFRLAFAFAFIACFTLWAERQGRQRFGVRNVRGIALAVSLIAFLFIYKAVYIPVKAGAWDIVVYQLTAPEAYNASIMNSEPFVTQTILNQVLMMDFHVPFDHFNGVLYQFLFFAPSFGAPMQTFNDYFQPQLFPQIVGMGMANNIWAEMWSTGGWLLLVLFITFFALVLCYLSTLMRIDNPELRAAIAVPAVTWAFYLHRNDVFVETNMIKRLLLVGAGCIILAMLSHDATHRLRTRVRHAVRHVARLRRDRRAQVAIR
jgi:hypothetical protein